MLTAILAALHLDDPASLKRALATGFGAGVILATPFLRAHGIPAPTDEMVLGLAGLVATFVLQSGARSRAADLAAIGAVLAPAGVQNPADAKP